MSSMKNEQYKRQLAASLPLKFCKRTIYEHDLDVHKTHLHSDLEPFDQTIPIDDQYTHGSRTNAICRAQMPY